MANRIHSLSFLWIQNINRTIIIYLIFIMLLDWFYNLNLANCILFKHGNDKQITFRLNYIIFG